MKKVEFTSPRQGRKHRVHMWIDTDTLDPLYGVECNVTSGKWAHVAVDGEVYLRDKPTATKAAKAWSAPAATTQEQAA